MKKLLHILLLFIIWNPGVAQVYNMGNLGTINNACGGLFYDSQGPGTNYQNNEFSTVTFCAPAGQVITFTFTDFATEAGWDYLDIYNGSSTASPLLGAFTGSVGPGVISSTIGGCLTFQFSSDGGTRRRGWEAAISCGDPPPSTNNGDTCPNSTPFCTGTTYTFNNNINVPSLGTINCLNSTPNPVWYYFEIENPGDLTIDIAQYDVFDFPIDVDFLLWGPFTDLPEGCTEIQNSTAPVVDCSFSGSAFEQANAVGTLAGEVYILLLTNFDNELGYITFNSASSSTATTNCDILCSITALSATPTTCDPTTNTYDVSGELTVTNPPESGILTITSSCGGTTTVSAPFGSQISYTISSINATGGNCNVVASFSADASCTITESYTAPAACASVSLNCPDYANASTSPTTACSNQTYYLDVANTACAGQIFLTVEGNYGSAWGNEISWTVSSNLSGITLASGIGNTSGSNFSINYGPFDPLVHGSIFTLDVADAIGDGFDGVNGQIYVTQGGNTIGGPIVGEIGSGASSIFGANISISPATITVSTPAGNVVQTVQNCNDFRVPISIENPNFCNTINATLPWSVTCNSSGATLSSGSNTLTVYPKLPSSSNDVVSIQFNTSTCDWEVAGNNDCDAGDIGTIFTISPNPTSLANTVCTGGNQVFDVTYIGLGGGPNCCSTGGALGPITTNTSFSGPNFNVASSPFGGTNNSAYLNIPPNVLGGDANSFSLNFSLNGFCYNPQGIGSDYWVTVLVDGAIVSDINTTLTNYNINFDLTDLPSGFNASSNIEIYIYPNTFSSLGINSTYSPSVPCGSLGLGQWNFASINTVLQVNYSELTPSPATCLYPTNAAFSCCSPTTVSNATSTICSGGSTSAVTTWQNAVVAANPTCVVYSSVLPVAGSIAPNNTLPSGINNTTASIIQTVSAYAYCDIDGSNSINIGDTYTLISSFSLTVNPPITLNITSTNPTCPSACNGTANVTVTGGTGPFTYTWTGPTVASGPNPTNLCVGIYSVIVTGAGGCSSQSSAPIPTSCFEIQSILIDACGNPENLGEMVFFQVGPNALNTSNLGLTWANTSQTYNGLCTNPLFISNVNATITGGGSLVAAPAILPPGANVVLITGNTAATSANLFTNLSTTLYVLFQCTQTLTAGHFANASSGTGVRNFSMNFGAGCTDAVSYSIQNLIGGDGATVVYSPSGTPTYINTVCNAPFISPSSGNVVLTSAISDVQVTASSNSICSGGSTILTASGATSYSWSPSTGLSATSGATVTASPSTTTTYTVTGTTGSCVESAQITIDVGTQPSATFSYPSLTYCTSVTSIQTPTIVGTGGGTFSSSPAGLTLNTSTGIITPNTSVAGTYVVTYTFPAAGTCPGGTTTAGVTIVATPTVSAPASASICSGSNPNLALTSATAGVTFNWTYSGGASGSGTGTPINTVLTNASCANIIVNYSITATINGCTGPAISVPVTVKPKPTSTFTLSSDTICLNENVVFNYTGISCPGNTFTNTFTSATIVSGTSFGPYTLSWSAPGSYPIIFQVSNPTAGCTAPTFRDTVVVKALPVASSSGTTTICSNQTTALTLSSTISGTTYAWTVVQTNVTGASSGTGASIAQTLTTTGALAGTAVYTVTPTANGCAGLPISITVSVNPIPVASSSGTTTICSNQTTALTLSSTIAGTTYAWTVVQTNVTGASSGTGASIAQTLSTTGASAGTAVYTVTPTANGCAGLPITITITVNPLPNAGTNGAITVCSNSTTVDLFVSVVGGPTSGGNWSGPSSLTGGSLGTFVPGTNAAGTYTYSLTSAGCTSTTNVVVTVNPVAIVSAGSAQSICSGGSVTLAGSISGGASTGTWSAPSGSFSNASSITSTYTPSITNGTVTLTLSSIDPDAGGPCTVVTSTVVITVNPTPNVTTSGSTTICSNQTTALSLTSAVVGTSFSWTVVQSGVTGAANGSGSSINQTLTTTGATAGSAVYTITPTANGCIGTPTPITVIVNPLPIANFSGTTPICSPASPAITLSSNLSGTTYAWTVAQTNVTGASSGSGTSINQTLTASSTINGTAVYTVIPTSNGCPGATLPITIIVKPKPVVSTLGGSYSICSGPTLATANSPSIQVLSNLGVGTTFAWSGSDGTSGTSNPISYAIPNNSCTDQLITYSVTPTFNGCVGTAIIIPLTVRPNPIAVFTVSASTICQNSSITVNFTGSACPTSSFIWTWPTGAIVSGSGQGPYTVTFPNSGNFSIDLSLSNGGFCTQTFSLPISVTERATASAGTDITMCSGSTINLAGIIGGSATSSTWSASSGTFSDVTSLTSTYTPSITSGVVQLTLVTNDPDGVGPCTPAVSTINITVNLAAGISAGANQTICSGNTASLFGTVTGSASLGTWSAPSGTFNNATLPNAVYTPPANASGNYVLTFTSNDPAGACPAVTSNVTVTVNPAATVAIGFFTQSICSGTTINLPGSFGGGATSVTWSAPSGTFGNPNLAATTYTPSITSGTVNITLTTNDPDGAGPCAAISISRTISVTQQLSATLTYPGSPYCQNETTNPLPVIVGTPGGTFSASPSSGLDLVSFGQISPSSSSAGTYTITYTIGATGGCPAFACSTQVVIYNQPPAPVISPTSICAGTPQTIVASNGSWFGFSVDGVEVQAPSANNTYITPALALNSQVCVTSYPPAQFVFDGLLNEAAWGPAWAYSLGGPPSSGFGLNNIDALYLKDRSGYLFGGIAGRVQNNSNNRVLLFLDTKAGGFNSLASWSNRNNSPYYSIQNLNSGITFDPGFEPDYILGMNQASGIAYFDLYDMQNNTNVFLGDDISSNFLGYTANAGTGNYGQGFEFAIPMSAISNPVGSMKAFVILVNDPGISASTTLSNQFLTRANSGDLNYGNGAVDFGSAAPNPITYSLSPECSTQSCIVASASATTVTGFSYVSPLCQNTSNPSPTFVSGYTPGGTFSANSGDLSINPSTGIINLAGSLPGTYIITYSIAASSCSPAGSSIFSFTINASTTPVTGFTYTTPVCINGTNPLVIPASGFTSGGSYSYIAIPSGLSTGLSLNTSTGAINLASSTPGTYTVTYSFVANGCQTAGSTSFTIIINPLPTISPIYHD
jgi:hypothetical protein